MSTSAPGGPGPARRMAAMPSVIIFDVNETLSDMDPLKDAFGRAGLPQALTRPWFAELLRDGFALTTTNHNPDFADLATDSLHRMLTETLGDGRYQQQVHDIMDVFTNLSMHADAAPGITALSAIAELMTLSNGSTAVAETLTRAGGVHGNFSHFLGVNEASRWKPAREAYDYAAAVSGREPAALLMVAVHAWDIHGAHAAGLRTAWINRSGAPYPTYFTQPDLEARSLEDLAAVLADS